MADAGDAQGAGEGDRAERKCSGMTAMTNKQQEIFEFITHFIESNHYPPSYEGSESSNGYRDGEKRVGDRTILEVKKRAPFRCV